MSKYAELTKHKKPKEEIEFDAQQDLSAVLEKQYEFSKVKESTKEKKNNQSGSFLNDDDFGYLDKSEKGNKNGGNDNQVGSTDQMGGAIQQKSLPLPPSKRLMTFLFPSISDTVISKSKLDWNKFVSSLKSKSAKTKSDQAENTTGKDLELESLMSKHQHRKSKLQHFLQNEDKLDEINEDGIMKLPLSVEKESVKKRDSIMSSFTPKSKKNDQHRDSELRFNKMMDNDNKKRNSVLTPTNHKTNNNKFTKLLTDENEGATTFNDVLKSTQKSSYGKESQETQRKMEEALRKKKQLENELQAVSMDIKSLEATQSPVKNGHSGSIGGNNNPLTATRTSSSKQQQLTKTKGNVIRGCEIYEDKEASERAVELIRRLREQRQRQNSQTKISLRYEQQYSSSQSSNTNSSNNNNISKRSEILSRLEQQRIRSNDRKLQSIASDQIVKELINEGESNSVTQKLLQAHEQSELLRRKNALAQKRAFNQHVSLEEIKEHSQKHDQYLQLKLLHSKPIVNLHYDEDSDVLQLYHNTKAMRYIKQQDKEFKDKQKNQFDQAMQQKYRIKEYAKLVKEVHQPKQKILNEEQYYQPSTLREEEEGEGEEWDGEGEDKDKEKGNLEGEEKEQDSRRLKKQLIELDEFEQSELSKQQLKSATNSSASKTNQRYYLSSQGGSSQQIKKPTDIKQQSKSYSTYDLRQKQYLKNIQAHQESSQNGQKLLELRSVQARSKKEFKPLNINNRSHPHSSSSSSHVSQKKQINGGNDLNDILSPSSPKLEKAKNQSAKGSKSSMINQESNNINKNISSIPEMDQNNNNNNIASQLAVLKKRAQQNNDYILEARKQREVLQQKKGQVCKLEDWEKYSNDPNLSPKQKYAFVLQSASRIDHQAKLKQLHHKYDQSLQVQAGHHYIQSIEAKLALLDTMIE